MGDMPEAKYSNVERDSSSVMSQLTSTLGRNFSKSKAFKAAQQEAASSDMTVII